MKKISLFLVLAIFFNYLEYGGEFDLSWLLDFSVPQEMEAIATKSDLENAGAASNPTDPTQAAKADPWLGTGHVQTTFYDGALTLRKGPSTHYPAINWLPEDTQFTAFLEEQNYKNQTWIYVEVNGQFGWINKDYTNTTYRLDVGGANITID